MVAGFGTALLGAAALEGARQRLGDRAGCALAAAAAVLVLATHGRRLSGTGLDEVRGQTLPVFTVVAAETAATPGPLLELPLQDRQGRGLDREAMVGSTRHWLPLVNGFTGFPARHRDLLRAVVGRLPARAALADLVDLTHVRWILLHPDDAWADPAVRAAIAALPDVRQVATSDGWMLQAGCCCASSASRSIPSGLRPSRAARCPT